MTAGFILYPEETEFRNPLQCFRCRGLRTVITDPPMKASLGSSGVWSLSGRDFSGSARHHDGFNVSCKDCDGTGWASWHFLCAEPILTNATVLEPL